MNIEAQIDAVMKKYPSLTVHPDEDGYTLTGIVTMDKSYNDIPLYDDYHIKICVAGDFPKHIPSVFDINRDIPSEFMHFMDDNSFCLGATCELRSFLEDHPSLVAFIDEVIMSYLYSASYFRLYGSFPYGERSHGNKGIREAYRERYKTDDDRLLAHLLLFVIGSKPYRGHSPCPCGSGKHLRKCHGEQVIKDIKSEYHNDYEIDAYIILLDYLKDEERRVKKTNGEKNPSKNQL